MRASSLIHEHLCRRNSWVPSGRSAANAPILAELRAAEQRGALTLPVTELASSYIHMHVNRLIRSAQRAHELVLYDLLSRLYESKVARARQPKPAKPP